jgi:3-hydroxyacyl-CoA dehydrogenase
MTQPQMDEIVSRFKGTARYEDLKDCDLVMEAAQEEIEKKIDIFENLAQICSSDTIFVSNTSTILIEDIMATITHPQRTAGLHYFFPAHVNPLVEVIRQKKTSDETNEALKAFAVNTKKSIINVKDHPGFSINPVFIATYMLIDSFRKSYNVATLDSISREALGLKYGIMWVQNHTGLGTCYNAAKSLSDQLIDTDIGFLKVPETLKACFEGQKGWDLKDGPVIKDKTTRQVLINRILGSIFTISTHLVEKRIVSVADMEKGIKTSLAWPEGPFSMMNRLGMEKTRELIVLECYSGHFQMPKRFLNGIPEPWDLDYDMQPVTKVLCSA